MRALHVYMRMHAYVDSRVQRTTRIPKESESVAVGLMLVKKSMK